MSKKQTINFFPSPRAPRKEGPPKTFKEKMRKKARDLTTGQKALFAALASLIVFWFLVLLHAERTVNKKTLLAAISMQTVINYGVSKLPIPWLHEVVSEYPRWAW